MMSKKGFRVRLDFIMRVISIALLMILVIALFPNDNDILRRHKEDADTAINIQTSICNMRHKTTEVVKKTELVLYLGDGELRKSYIREIEVDLPYVKQFYKLNYKTIQTYTDEIDQKINVEHLVWRVTDAVEEIIKAAPSNGAREPVITELEDDYKALNEWLYSMEYFETAKVYDKVEANRSTAGRVLDIVGIVVMLILITQVYLLLRGKVRED